MRYAGDIVVLHPPPARRAARATRTISVRATASGSRAGTCRCPSASLYVIAFALRTVPRLKSRRALREAARGYRDGLRGPLRPRRRLQGADAVRG